MLMKCFKTALACLAVWFALGVNAQHLVQDDRFFYQLHKAESIRDWILDKYGNELSTAKAQAIANQIVLTSIDMKISPETLVGLIAAESRFKTTARSKHGALGLTQVMPRWHQNKLKGRNLFRIQDAVEVGAMVLKDCLEDNGGNLRKALGCYNGSKGSTGSKYAQKVLAHAKSYSKFALATSTRKTRIYGRGELYASLN